MKTLATASSTLETIFGPSGRAAELAHARPHRVAGLTLPPADANTHFHQCGRLERFLEEDERPAMCDEILRGRCLYGVPMYVRLSPRLVAKCSGPWVLILMWQAASSQVFRSSS